MALYTQKNRKHPNAYPRLRKRSLRHVAVTDSHDHDDDFSGREIDDAVKVDSKVGRKEKEGNVVHDSNPALSPGAFQCGICSQCFSTMKLLSVHMEDHCKDDIFQCNMCNDTFSKPEYLAAHLELHTNVVKAFKCGICNAGFLENSSLLSHLQEKHEVFPCLYKCNICHLLFKEVSKLVSHAAKKHPPVCKEYKCGFCSKRFTQGNRLTVHVQKHSKEETTTQDSESTSCPICQILVSPSKWRTHLKSHENGKNEIKTEATRKTRSNDRHHKKKQIVSSLEDETKIDKMDVSKKDHDDEQPLSENVHYGNNMNGDDGGDDENYDDDSIFDEADIPLRSGKRERKSMVLKTKSQEKKKPAIKNNKELIAAYKRIEPETQTEVYDCDVCGQRFQESVTFTQHRSDHFFDDKFCVNCQHCEQVYDSFEDLQGHIDDKKCRGYVCSTCGKSFSLEPNLLIHIIRDHVVDKKKIRDLICPTCEKVFHNRTAFLRHASSHSEIKCIQCKLCRHSFTTPETLYGHLRTTHSLIPLTRKKYTFSCKRCNLFFMKMEALQNHESIVHTTTTCEAPVVIQHKPEPKKAKSKPKEPKEKVIISETPQIKRTGHWRSTEDDRKRRTCHICNRVFRRFKDVRRHIGTHTKPYLCSHCGKSFPYRYSLDAHIKAFHSTENPFKCEICNKYFSCPRSLMVHQRIHTGERPHQCHICQKQFRQVANLSMHLKLHNADKPIKCSLCDYRCRHMGYLKRHMSTHSKEKKHFCPICNKGFTEKPNLNHHLKRHTKIKNHVCTVCGHRFAERYYLNNHMRIHTKEKPYVCPVCNRAFTMRPNMVSHIKKTHPSYNYQPIRPSHHTVALNDEKKNENIENIENKNDMPSFVLETSHSLPINSIITPVGTMDDSLKTDVVPSTLTSSSTTALPSGLTLAPPPAPAPHHLGMLPPPPNIPVPVYHPMSSAESMEQPKLDVKSAYNPLRADVNNKFTSLLETQLLNNQNHNQQQQQQQHHHHQQHQQLQLQQQQQQHHYIREPQMMNDPSMLRNHQVVLPLEEQQNLLHEDPDRRLFVNLTPNRMSAEAATGFDLSRDVLNQNFPVALPGQADLMYTYPTLTTILDNGTFQCPRPFPPPPPPPPL